MIDKILMAIAWKLPRRLAYWCAIRVGSYATCGQYGHQIVPELKFMDALGRWPMLARCRDGSLNDQ